MYRARFMCGCAAAANRCATYFVIEVNHWWVVPGVSCMAYPDDHEMRSKYHGRGAKPMLVMRLMGGIAMLSRTVRFALCESEAVMDLMLCALLNMLMAPGGRVNVYIQMIMMWTSCAA